MGKKKRIMGFVLAVVLVAGMILPASATDVQDIKDKEQQLKTEKDEIASEQASLAERVQAISASMREAEQELEAKQAEIEQAEQDLILAKMEENKQYASMKVRIKYLYENGNISLIEIFLESENMSDFLNKAEYIAMLSEYDRDKLGEFQNTVRRVQEKEQVLQQEYEQITVLQDKLFSQRSEAENLLKQRTSELAELEEELAEIKEQIKKAEEEEKKRKEAEEARKRQEEERRKQEEAKRQEEKKKQEEAKRQEEEKQQEEAKKQEEEKKEQELPQEPQESPSEKPDDSADSSKPKPSAPVISGNGYFTHPCPGMSYQSSYFGEVRYGIGDLRPHKGHDFAAPAGTPIYAAAAGRVLIAGYSYSAGYWVVIDHGGGLVTKYMHMYQNPAVSAGEQVAKGQYIGGVGTTGQSTGNHLHFQVEEYGVAVNPSKYM